MLSVHFSQWTEIHICFTHLQKEASVEWRKGSLEDDHILWYRMIFSCKLS